MNKYEFLAEIREGLGGMDRADIDRSLDYYREMIDDRMDDGLSEEEAIAALGPAERIIAEIRGGASAEEKKAEIPTPVSEKQHENGENESRKAADDSAAADGGEKKTWNYERITNVTKDILLRHGNILCLALDICFWCVAVPMLIAGGAVAISSLAVAFAAFVALFTGEMLQFVMMLGGALCAAGIGVLLTSATIIAMRAYKKLSADLHLRADKNKKGAYTDEGN